MYLADTLKEASIDDYVQHRYQVVLGYHQRCTGFVPPGGAREETERSNAKGENASKEGRYSF